MACRRYGVITTLVCGVLVVGCSAAVQVAPKAVGTSGENLEVLTNIALDGVLTSATDLRWEDGNALLITDLGYGLNRLTGLDGEPVAEPISPGRGRFSRWIRLAYHPPYTAGSFVAFNVWWTGSGDTSGEYLVEYPGDIDLHGDRLLVSGVRRNEAGAVAGDGFVAWVGRLGGDLEPLLPSTDGAGADRMVRCASLDLPRVRFLPDGRAVVVPGAEPGVFLYDPAGRLERTWDTESLGVDSGCPLSEDQVARLSTDERARVGWRNRRRLIDEILPWPGGFAALVRSRADGVTRWDLLEMDFKGGVRNSSLPLTSGSRWSHLRGDVLADRAALLMISPTADPPEDSPDRLSILRWPISGGADE